MSDPAATNAVHLSRATSGGSRLALSLLGAALICLVAAGAILWWQQASAIFGSLAAAALAWCF